MDIMVILAAIRFLQLKRREINPDGHFDGKSRWYPDPEIEKQECCKSIRDPSAAWPYSLMVHCRTVNHVSACFGVKPLDVKRAAKFLDLFDSELLCTIEKSLQNQLDNAKKDGSNG